MTHQVLVDTRPLAAKSLEERCQEANILVHCSTVLRIDPQAEPSVVRISVQEVTRQGMAGREMERIAALIDAAVRGTTPRPALADDVAALVSEFPTMTFTFAGATR